MDREYSILLKSIKMILQIKILLRYKELLTNLVMENLKLRYRGAVLGYLWSLLNPILMMIVYSIIFSYIVRIGVKNYPLFLLCALLPWSFFSTSLIAASSSIVDNFNLINKVYFPREIFPISVVLANLFHLIISMIILLVFLSFTQIKSILPIFMLPFAIIAHVVFTMGISLLLSCLTVFYRDIKHILEIVMMIWFYATPIIYPLSMVPEKLQIFFFLNPMVWIISIYRSILFYGEYPAISVILTTYSFSFLIFYLGCYFFQKYDNLIPKSL